MKNFARRSRLLCCMLALTAGMMAPMTASRAWAQEEELEYTKEIGGSLGINFMLSDLNSKWYGASHLSGGAAMRFILSPRMAIKTTLGYNAVKDDTEGVKDFYPAVVGQSGTERLQYSMSGGIIDLNALYELHFLPYGWYRNYLGHKRLTPYLQLGIGMLYSTAGKAFTVDLPVGLGLKYKIGKRLNLSLDWTLHFTPSDKLDGLAAPAGIEGSGFHGKDFYSKTMLSLTYDISPKCPTCNKDE